MPTVQPIKQTAQEIIDHLPVDASWDDLLYRLVECREIELGLADSDAGRTTPVEQVMEEFGVKPQ
jgi:predicted transcriptional regulator